MPNTESMDAEYAFLYVFAENGLLNFRGYRFIIWKVQMQDVEGTVAG
jgi:hypothetical protein